MLQKKKPCAFKTVIHLSDLDMSIYEGFLFSLEIFVLQDSLAEAQWKNLVPHPADFNSSQIVVSPSLGQQVPKCYCSVSVQSSMVRQTKRCNSRSRIRSNDCYIMLEVPRQSILLVGIGSLTSLELEDS